MSSSLFGNIPQGSGDEHMTANGVADPAAAPPAAAGGLFDPGPSFSEDEPPAERLSQMPAWLQTFAATVGEPDEDAAGAPASTGESVAAPVLTAPAPDEPVTELPGWLAEERPAPAGAGPDASALVAPAAAALISEDDLPEWLRAIAPADDGDALVAFGADVAIVAASERPVLATPSIGRAWMQGHDQPALSEGASMFALMARESVATALPAPTAEPVTGGVGLDVPGPQDAEAPTPRAESLASPVRADTATPEAARPRRMWVVYALALLVVILVLVTLRLVI